MSVRTKGRRMKTVFAVGLTFAFATLAFVRAQPDEARVNAPGELVRVVPLVRLNADSDNVLTFMFENASKEAIRYMPAGDRVRFMDLRFDVLKDGVVLERRWGDPNVLEDKSRVKELRPGQGILHTLRLKDQYGQLKPGRYSVEAKIERVPKGYGLTPLRLRQKVLIFDLQNERD